MPCAEKTRSDVIRITAAEARWVNWLRVAWDGAIRGLRETIAWTIERQRQRNALAELNDHMLKDIGISREEARREVGKWFWQ
ncbi:MAG TPA: DUF1127 domain-containing protein [Pseudolabrys sp.]|nr:DUF1127 domain-containing protein [Pseudolabrys sp.]